MTIYRSEIINEAERLSIEFIQAFEKLKQHCSQAGYPGKLIEYEGILHETSDSFVINELGYKYFQK